MDVDTFSRVRAPRWERLRTLSRRRSLTGAEADEFARLYQATAGDLSAVRSAAPEPGLISRLSVLLASSRVWLTGAHTMSTGDVGRYFTSTLPAAMYRVRWWGAWTTVIVFVLGALAAWWTVTHPEALDLIGDERTRAAIANEEFASYYTEYSSASFGAQVWTNNAWIAALCIGLGITGFYPVFLLYNTVIQLGTIGAVMAEAGALDIFFQLIIPHGLLELSAVFVAAGAGLRLFWTMLVPGPRTRADALSIEGRATVGVVFGLTIALFASGLIEGYVTGSAMPWWLKIVIGSIAFIGFWVYIFVVGRYAARAGASGDVDGDLASDTVAVAA